MNITNANVVHKTNDIPRLLAYSMVHASYSFSNSIGTSYQAPDDDTNLETSFDVPPSGIVEVEFGFYATHVEGQTTLGRLVDGCGSEFVEEHIDDDELTIVTHRVHALGVV